MACWPARCAGTQRAERACAEASDWFRAPRGPGKSSGQGEVTRDQHAVTDTLRLRGPLSNFQHQTPLSAAPPKSTACFCSLVSCRKVLEARHPHGTVLHRPAGTSCMVPAILRPLSHALRPRGPRKATRCCSCPTAPWTSCVWVTVPLPGTLEQEAVLRHPPLAARRSGRGHAAGRRAEVGPRLRPPWLPSDASGTTAFYQRRKHSAATPVARNCGQRVLSESKSRPL